MGGSGGIGGTALRPRSNGDVRPSPAAAQQVAERVLRGLPELVDRLGRLYRAEVDEYAQLPDETLRREVLPFTRRFVEAFFRALAERRTPSIGDVTDLEETGRRRLEMGVSLDAMLHVYRLAGRGVFEAVVRHVRPGEEVALAEIGPRWMDFVDLASSRTATGYLLASQEQVRRVEARRGAMLQSLLAAETPAEAAGVAAEFSLSLARSYVPVVAAAGDAAARIDALAEVCPAGSLVGARGRVVLVLAPIAAPSVAPLRRVLGEQAVVCGRAVAPGPALRSEVEHVERVLELVVDRGLHGVFTPHDLLLEQLVAGNERVARQLVDDVVAPIAGSDRTGLLEATLRTYLLTGSIAETADREAAHPNTITYRLRKVATVTGFDPRVPQEAAVLALALACHRGG